MIIQPDSLYFTLEVGPIEAEQRVILMESLKEKDIFFNKQGLALEAQYTRIHSETRSIAGLQESELLDVFEVFYENEKLKVILEKLQIIYEETVSRLE